MLDFLQGKRGAAMKLGDFLLGLAFLKGDGRAAVCSWSTRGASIICSTAASRTAV